MCVFDDVGGTPQLRWSRELPALGSCAKRPCWQESPKPGPLYFNYVDRTTAPAGKTTFKMKLRGGDAAHAQLLAKGKGPGVAMPA
jgi:hypothetical protein